MNTGTPLYLDYNATAPILPEVAAAMSAVMQQGPYNASSVHGLGRKAAALIEKARGEVASALGAEGYNVVFTGSGTEANNLALKGSGLPHVIVSAVEHSAVMQAFPEAQKLLVDKNGIVCVETLKELLATNHKPQVTPLISIQLANNETGVVQPIAEIAAIVHAAGGVLHVDAVQAVGKMPLDVSRLHADSIAISAHKFGGPQGVGALLFKPGLEIKSQIVGGGQELGLRAGTHNVAGIVGLAEAAKALPETRKAYQVIAALRDRLEAEILAIAPEAAIAGKNSPRLPNTSLILMPGVKNETQLIHFDLQQIYVSAGAACSSGKVTVSHVLLAMGHPKEMAETAIRVSLGPTTTENDIAHFVACWKTLYLRTKAQKEAA